MKTRHNDYNKSTPNKELSQNVITTIYTKLKGRRKLVGATIGFARSSKGERESVGANLL
jgi:hypothetical protein